jgi:hypothetical protein
MLINGLLSFTLWSRKKSGTLSNEPWSYELIRF